MATGHMTRTDALGVTFAPGERVTVIHWGTARLNDVGIRGVVGKINRVNVVVIADDGDEVIANPREVAVARRDGQAGHEGNVGR